MSVRGGSTGADPPRQSISKLRIEYLGRIRGRCPFIFRSVVGGFAVGEERFFISQDIKTTVCRLDPRKVSILLRENRFLYKNSVWRSRTGFFATRKR